VSVIRAADLASVTPVTTANEYVYHALRALIVRGSLHPGTALRLADVASDLGVSTMPVRAALVRLESEGLVCQLSRRGGAIVAPLELEEFTEIQAIRTALETLAAREGATRVDEEDVAEMRALYERARKAADENDLDVFLEDVSGLHNVCYRAAGWPHLLSLIEDHQRRAERYIRIALTRSSPGLAAPIDFQENFVFACEAKDGVAAGDILHNALRWTVEQLAPVIESLNSEATDSDRSPVQEEELA
jgi:DNA-binding GntR family transcriptional regulator